MKRGVGLCACAILLAGCTSSLGNLTADPSVRLPDGADGQALQQAISLQVSPDADVVIGTKVKGTRVGTDYTCLLVNRSWFLVNNLAVPSTDEIRPEWVYLPATAVGDWPKGSGGPDAPVTMGSALRPLREANNIRTETPWMAYPETCEAVPVYVSKNAPEQLVERLLSEAGQQALAADGIAYPLAAPTPDSVAALAPEPQSR